MHECDLPQNIHAIIPVPAPNHPNNKLVNKFSIVMLPLELSKSDSLRRCREIERENRIMSNSPVIDLLSALLHGLNHSLHNLQIHRIVTSICS